MSLMGSSTIPAVLAARMAKGLRPGRKLWNWFKRELPQGIS
nr:hypothetical protein [Enterocloster clostridioformis]